MAIKALTVSENDIVSSRREYEQLRNHAETSRGCEQYVMIFTDVVYFSWQCLHALCEHILFLIRGYQKLKTEMIRNAIRGSVSILSS